MNLEQLSNATIAPLSELACIPTVAPGVPFEQKDPSLKIYLSSNPLTKIPGAIFNLEHLTYLSLRSTKITELPPVIGQLQNLVTLNVSMSRLRCLPGELLDMLTYPSKLKQLLIHPNPFYEPAGNNEVSSQPEEAEWENSSDCLLLADLQGKESVMKVWIPRQELSKAGSEYPMFEGKHPSIWRARIRARTPVHSEDCHGATTSSYALPDWKISSEKVLTVEDLARPASVSITDTSCRSAQRLSRVPSLLELALRSCSRTSQLPFLPSYLPDDAPAHLPDLLRRIVTQGDTNANSGALPCSSCRRRVIVPAARWIEWWDLRKLRIQNEPANTSSVVFNLGVVPFMKRACSYGCLPKATEVDSLLPGTLRFNVTA